jgi:hypothetical protein
MCPGGGRFGDIVTDGCPGIGYVIGDPSPEACAVIDSVMDIDTAAGRIAHDHADAMIACPRPQAGLQGACDGCCGFECATMTVAMSPFTPEPAAPRDRRPFNPDPDA